MSARRVAALFAASLAAGGVFVGVAHAYYGGTVAGTGTGSVTTSAAAMTFTLTGATTATPLYPGGPAGTVTANVTNPFDRSVAVTSVVMTPTATGGKGTCTAASFTTDSSALPTSLSPGTNAYALSIVMDADAQDGCQNADITLAVTINGKL